MSHKLATLSDFLEQNYSKDEVEQIRAEAQLEFSQLKLLQADVTNIVLQFMSSENIGFNEMVRRFQLSPSLLAKLQRGEGNITLATLAHIASATGSKIRIVVE